MQKFSLVCVIVLAALIFPLSAYAITPTDGPHINVDNDPTIPTDDRTEFAWDETPVSFVQFLSTDVKSVKQPDHSLLRTLNLDWEWKWGTETWTDSVTYNVTADGYNINTWRSLTDWETIKVGRTGDWTVTTSWDNSGMGGGSDMGKSFKLNAPIVPEPVSSALFLIGGTCLAAWQIRRKKRSA